MQNRPEVKIKFLDKTPIFLYHSYVFMQRRTNFFYNINNLVKEIIHKNSWDSCFVLSNISRNWEQIVGKNVAEHTRASAIKGNRLFVDVDNPIWSTQLLLLKNKIIENINKMTENSHIKDIYFNNVNAIERISTDNKAFPAIKNGSRMPNPEAIEKIKSIVAGIRDEDLRAKFEKIFINSVIKSDLTDTKQ